MTIKFDQLQNIKLSKSEQEAAGEDVRIINLVSSLVPAAPGPEAPPRQESGAILWRLLTQRQPDRQEPSGLPGDLLMICR